MILGALLAGSIAGITAAAVTVLGFGASLWLGLFAWWLVGTAVTLAPLVVMALLQDDKATADDFVTA